MPKVANGHNTSMSSNIHLNYAIWEPKRWKNGQFTGIFQFSVKILKILTKIGTGLKSTVSLNENFRFNTSRSSNMILYPFALSSGLSVRKKISELRGGRVMIFLFSVIVGLQKTWIGLISASVGHNRHWVKIVSKVRPNRNSRRKLADIEKGLRPLHPSKIKFY